MGETLQASSLPLKHHSVAQLGPFYVISSWKSRPDFPTLKTGAGREQTCGYSETETRHMLSTPYAVDTTLPGSEDGVQLCPEMCALMPPGPPTCGVVRNDLG